MCIESYSLSTFLFFVSIVSVFITLLPHLEKAFKVFQKALKKPLKKSKALMKTWALRVPLYYALVPSLTFCISWGPQGPCSEHRIFSWFWSCQTDVYLGGEVVLYRSFEVLQ